MKSRLVELDKLCYDGIQREGRWSLLPGFLVPAEVFSLGIISDSEGEILSVPVNSFSSQRSDPALLLLHLGLLSRAVSKI